MEWTKKSVLGRGAFGTVYLAKVHGWSCRLPSFVAVKSSLLSNSTSLKHERYVLDELKPCPSIICCFGDEVTTEKNGEQFYNVFLEYANKGCLYDQIKKTCDKGLSDCIVRKYTRSILLGLNHMHQKGYTHCDIKPQNVVIFGSRRNLGSETVKLADLGLARKESVKKEKSEHGGFEGTAMYAAPESALDDEFGKYSDVWAVGCTVLEMITGKPPWESNLDAWSIIYTLCYTDDMPQIPLWVSKEARDFLSRCLIRDYKLRWTVGMLLDHPFVASLRIDHMAHNNLNLSPLSLESL